MLVSEKLYFTVKLFKIFQKSIFEENRIFK